MSWKSTINISRSEAKRLIRAMSDDLDSLSNEELSDKVEGLGYGETPGLSYFGHNFIVVDDNRLDELE